MQSSRECTLRAIEFNYPDRIPICTFIQELNQFDINFKNKINYEFEPDILLAVNIDPTFRPEKSGQDEWGCIWETMGNTMGEVKENPLNSWDNFPEWKKKIPDFKKLERYIEAKQMRVKYPDRFIMGGLGFLMMDIINFRGYSNYMMDLYLERDNLEQLIDLIYCCAKDSIDKYAEIGLDAVIAWEDWGLQDRFMMKPDLWREIFKVRMGNMVSYIHSKNMKYILHSCGNILEIMDDLIEIGVDVIQMDQQKLMGLDKLHKYAGKICFFNPVDIQYISNYTDLEGIRKYAIEMADKLSTKAGGFMYKMYSQPKSIEIHYESLVTECKTFISYNPYNS